MTSNPYVLFLLGGALLVIGAELLVRGASRLAVAIGISPLVVGLTVVAFGTSAPEMAVTVGSAYAGQAEVALGNVVGSNIFNVLFILGLGGLVAPNSIPVPDGALSFDVPIMLGVAIACLPIFFTGFAIARWEAAVFLGYYAAYVTYLVADAQGHALTSRLGAAITWFVLPLTVLTVAITVVRHRRAQRTAAP